MKRSKRTVLLCIGYLILISVFPVMADSRMFDISGIDPSITKIEYKIGEQAWKSVDLNYPSIEVLRSTTENELILRQYHGKKRASYEYIYRYDQGKDRWVYVVGDTAVGILPVQKDTDTIELSLAPYATIMFTDPAIWFIYTLSLAGGVDLSLSFPSHRHVVYSLGLEAGWAKSTDIWADSFAITGGKIGVGYRFNLTDSLDLTPSLAYGMRFHFGIDGIIDDLNFHSHIIAANLSIGYTVAPKTRIFATPHVQLMFDSTRHGLLYGLHSGAQFVL